MRSKIKTNDALSFLLIIVGIALGALLIAGYMVDLSHNADRGARNSPTHPPVTFQVPTPKEPVHIIIK